MKRTVKDLIEECDGYECPSFNEINFYSDFDGRKLGEYNLWTKQLFNQNLLNKKVLYEKCKTHIEGYITREVVVEV